MFNMLQRIAFAYSNKIRCAKYVSQLGLLKTNVSFIPHNIPIKTYTSNMVSQGNSSMVHNSYGVAKNISIPTIIEAVNCTMQLKNLTFNSRHYIQRILNSNIWKIPEESRWMR